MEQTVLKNYINMLQNAQDVLIGIEPNPNADWDEAILTALRDLGEIKAYFHNLLPLSPIET